MTIPNNRNFCGGNFQDWLEVNLTDKCNGSCSWCIEKHGWHPEYHAPWKVIADAAIKTKKKNIILLGGEPTLFKDISELVFYLARKKRNVWITTNGSLLTPKYVKENLSFVHGVNISIHSDNLRSNFSITGIDLDYNTISSAISKLRSVNASVRLNCNCIKGHIDSIKRIRDYIRFGHIIGANKIRFAELKQDDEGFVDLAAITNHKYGTNDNPFKEGCNSDAVINNMPVNFRQMCGLQTTRREKPENPLQFLKQVLYYDGKLYDGWQLEDSQMDKLFDQMDDLDLRFILNAFKQGKITIEETENMIKANKILKRLKKTKTELEQSGGCRY